MGQNVVAASAGNHAQGVALAVRMLGIEAKIYMPLSTPDEITRAFVFMRRRPC